MEDGGSTEDIYSGSLISVRVRTLPQPGGGVRRFEIVEHPDAVAIVALREDAAGGPPTVAMVRQERPAVGGYTWEIPAGLVRPDERDDPERAARRELFEETGYVAGTLRLLAREYPSPGFSTETISVYLANGVRPAPSQNGPVDTNEIPELRWVPFGDAQTQALRGQTEDGKTLLGLTLARATLSVEPRGDAMPFDVTTPPFRRDAPYRTDGASSGGDETGLKLESMLLEEFNYASVTAYQAMEDRARMFNLYLLVIGIFGSVLGALYQIAGSDAQPLSIIALVIAWIAGISFFVQLIRLRQAFLDSLKTMNAIKDFYIERFKGALPENPGSVFRWRTATMPRGEHRGTVTYVVCHTVAFLGSLCFGGAAFLANDVLVTRLPGAAIPALGNFQSVVVAAVFFVGSYLGHSLYFNRTLNSKRAKGGK